MGASSRSVSAIRDRFNLTGDGNNARNLFIVLIAPTTRPPRRVFHFGLRRHWHTSDKSAGLPAFGLASRTFEGHREPLIVGLRGMSNPENALFRVRRPATCHLPVEARACFR